MQSPFAFLGSAPAASGSMTLAPVDAETLRDCVAAWTARGHAITFGLTSDGGAASVTLLAGGQRQSRYFTEVADFEDFLKVVTAGANTP